MCGIAGLFDGMGLEAFGGDLLARMTRAIAHRGPDGEGFYSVPGLALGHRRLAVVDLASGAQPMLSHDRALAIVFNGEIYNFRELADELKAAGHTFRTRSDTEVILEAWRKWGERCVEHLEGMFAFALWDSAREVLFIARDRIGKKPLYYSVAEGRRLAFASELKALTHCPWVDRTVSPEAIEEYLSFGYVPDPKTIYRNVFKLPPAHSLTWRRGEKAVIAPYWQLDLTPGPAMGMAAAAAELNERLRIAVRRRLISDVPFGAFLSGGVDSSGIVAHMAGVMSEPVKTCTIGFGEISHDERDLARKLATRYGTDHVESVLRPEALSGSTELLDRIAGLYDEPFADSSAIPTLQVCAVARERVTVVLSGDGGDEVFAGYRRYRWHVGEHRVRALLPQAVRGPLFGTLARLYPQLDWAPRMFRARTTLRELAETAAGAYFNNVAVADDRIRPLLYTERFRSALQGYSARMVLTDLMAGAPSDDPLLQAQFVDMKTWLPGRMLVKVDRASMAHGLEVRNPYLDHNLIQWALSLPASLRLAGSEPKAVLKKSLEPLVPHELLYRPKQGFSIPLAAWLRGPLQSSLRRAMTAPALLDTGLFQRDALARLIEGHVDAKQDHSAVLWALMMLERFLSRDPGLRTG